MVRRLPPLSAIRAFEVAARHGHFSRAANELGVTHSAISHQIKALEEYLGLRLFHRTGKQVHLTEAGDWCARYLSYHFDSLEEIFARIITHERHISLTVAVETDMADLWLMPRLGSFEKQNPQMSPSLLTQENLRELPQTAQCALIWDSIQSTGWQHRVLFRNSMFPVGHPNLLHERPVLSAQDLKAHRLLHDRDRAWWRRILSALDIEIPDRGDDPVYSRSNLSLNAAAAGRGLAIADEITARPFLESGQLVPLLGLKIPTELAATVLHRESETGDPRLKAFLAWLDTQADEHSAWYAHFWATR